MNVEKLVAAVLRHVRDLVEPALEGMAEQIRAALIQVREEFTDTFVAKAELDEHVAECLKALPPPEPGNDGRNAYEVAKSLGFDGDVYAWMDSLRGSPASDCQVATAVAEYLRAHPVPVPKDGTSVTIDDVRPLLESTVASWALEFERRGMDIVHRCLDRIEKPKDGTSVTIEDVRPLIQGAVDEAVKTMPVPKDGTSVTIEDVRPLIQGAVDEAVKTMPVPKDGTSVTIDDVRPLFDAAMASWALEFERRANDIIQSRMDRIEKPKDGKDALQLDDFDVEISNDERTLTLVLANDEKRISRSVRLSHILDRGTWQHDSKYLRGDAVTLGGNLWVAQKDGPIGRPGQSEGWRLAVRQGRPGGRN